MRILLTRALFLIAVISMPLLASPLDDARNSGQVIESSDGYVKAKSGVPADVQALVKDVNERRRAAYEKIAKKNGLSVAKVAAESYAKRMKKSH